MFRFEELEVWKLSIAYAKDCYAIVRKLPKTEVFALGEQLRRAALSISNNIAEGSTGSSQNFKRYIVIAVGSTLETVNMLYFCKEMGYINEREREVMYQRAELLIRKLRSFSRSLD